MDWSPASKKCGGRNTLWPYDSKTGWSYCVMIPSWLVQTGSGASSDSLWNPIVLKRVFPKKYFPPSPPKHDLLRINSNRQLLEERRRALEEWMGC
ncbi:hypothetical protein M5K25_004056 [Dendrobium thyrsiflorum]|uniref:PX domain-containing protein n=1 Tax=Dendrobium thyrsiflorum TaxID=117978 RepID=A0ABD0VSF2_DENTH